MRPDQLNPLFVPADSLKGVGATLARPLERLGLTRLKDFIYHLPDRFVERRAVADLDEASVGENIVIALTPIEYRAAPGRGPLRVLASDAAGNICAVAYFGRNSGWGKKQLPLGANRAGWPDDSISTGRCFRSFTPIMLPRTARRCWGN